MFRRLILPLAYIATLTGCVSAPPRGAFVEYHDGQAPATRKVKYEATYELCAKDQPSGTPPLTAHHIAKGERVGFCRASDGSLWALAPGYSLPLAPGTYTWEVVPGSGPPPKERFWCEVRDHSRVAGRVILIIGGVAVIALLIAGVVIVIALASSGSFLNFT